MRSIMKMALCLITAFTLASCSSNTRTVATEDEADVQHEYKSGKRLLNETNY